MAVRFLKPHVANVLVCDPRSNALLKAGKKSDRIDARKLSELLYLNTLQPGWVSQAAPVCRISLRPPARHVAV